MSRHSSSGSYGHAIRWIGPGHYRLSWTVDRHYPDSRLRFPKTAERDTDRAGATRFARRWNLVLPEPKESARG